MKECKTKVKASIDVCPDNLVEEMSRMVNEEKMSVNAAAKEYVKQFNKINKDKGIAVSVGKVRMAYNRSAGLVTSTKKDKKLNTCSTKDTENEGVIAHESGKSGKNDENVVSKSEYEALKKEHDETLRKLTARLAELEKENASLNPIKSINPRESNNTVSKDKYDALKQKYDDICIKVKNDKEETSGMFDALNDREKIIQKLKDEIDNYEATAADVTKIQYENDSLKKAISDSETLQHYYQDELDKALDDHALEIKECKEEIERFKEKNRTMFGVLKNFAGPLGVTIDDYLCE